MKIKQIMSKKIVTVGMDDNLSVVKEIFDNASFHHLLVVGRGHFFGVISDRDLLKSISPNAGTISETRNDHATLNKKAHQILTRKPVTLTPECDVYDAVEVFHEHAISCIPIVNDEKYPIGIITWRDVLSAVRKPKS